MLSNRITYQTKISICNAELRNIRAAQHMEAERAAGGVLSLRRDAEAPLCRSRRSMYVDLDLDSDLDILCERGFYFKFSSV